jgi:hypothetical protein
MTGRLISCEKHHPDSASEIVLDATENGTRKRCLACVRIRVKTANRLGKQRPIQMTHGDNLLPRLTWTPPNF